MEKKGLAGRLAEWFVDSKLTPVIVIASILLGVAAVWVTPKEEEPQIIVPMVDIQLAAPGLNASEVERYVTEVVERELWGVEGVEYVYSASQAHGALVTVRFKVGEPVAPSLVKIHHHMMLAQRQIPSSVTVQSVRALSIDDVPFLAVSFASEQRSGYELRQQIAVLARKLSSTPDLAKTELLGGQKRVVRVIADPARMTANGANIQMIAAALSLGKGYQPLGQTGHTGTVVDVELNAQLTSVEQIRRLPVAQRGGKVILLSDVATLIDGPETETRASVLFDKSLHDGDAKNAVTLVFSKRKGANVATLSEGLLQQIEKEHRTLPSDISMSVIRNYGESAQDKTHVLIEHLLIATLSVAALIAVFMGFRASLVVVVAIPVTLALTLAIYYFLGYTLNRVTFFALIFSIGILVDDAIVVVENIERHLADSSENKGLIKSTIDAVAEVGNPTILATVTVIAAILPMAFVQGLMGPYMKPIPVGASLAMVMSLLIAFTVTPWAAVRLLKKPKPGSHAHAEGRLDRLYRKIMAHLLGSRRYAFLFGMGTLILLLAAISLVGIKAVKVKMLPFDNKNEFQIIVDYPASTGLDISISKSKLLAEVLLKDPNVEKVQIFVGESAPFSFSGMVKHTFLRKSAYLADLHVVLKDHSQRSQSSHEIIQELRNGIAQFGRENQAVTKVLEIPPGPPVMATMVAEVYAPDRESQLAAVGQVRAAFESVSGIVDLDDTRRVGRDRMMVNFDFEAGGKLGISAAQVAQMGQYLFSDTHLVSLNDVSSPESVDVVLSLDADTRAESRPYSGAQLSSFETGTAHVSDAISSVSTESQTVLYRKNLRPVSYVTAELSGAEEAPVYAILSLMDKIPFELRTVDIPWPLDKAVVKWDGEWFITYEVFRDLGAAFLVVMVFIYVLILAWFRRFLLPLVIMLPIPISLIGIIPGHWIMGSYFTATSMIGFIAGAGIIVRNAIILVDFIEHQIDSGMALKSAVISAGVLRFRPMLLTAGAVVVGSSVMLADPIFQGLAVSLIFGEVAATLISRFAVPLLYYGYRNSRLYGERK